MALFAALSLYAGGNRDTVEISNANLTLENLKNGQTGKLQLSAALKVENNPPAAEAKGMLQGTIDGAFNLALTPDAKPASIQGNTRIALAQASGAMAQFLGFGANLECDITPTDVKQVALRFTKSGTPLGQLLVSGPFQMDKSEGRLSTQVLNIDKQVLNLAGASSGIDFGPTTITSSNQVELAKGGSLINAVGQFNIAKLQLTRTNQTTPPLDFNATYNVTVDSSASNALLRAFSIDATQKGNPIIKGALTSPMPLSWGNAGNVGDAALNLTVTHLDLADWKPFLAEVAPAGDVNSTLKLTSRQGGKLLDFDLQSRIENLTAGSGSNQISQATVVLLARGQATDLKQFNFPEYKLEVALKNQPVVSFSGSGTYDTVKTNADLKLDARVFLARLVQALPQQDLAFSSGEASVLAHVTQNQNLQNITGTMNLTGLTGKSGTTEFRAFGSSMIMELGMTPKEVQIRKFSGKLTEGTNSGGAFDVSGTYDLTNKAAQIKAVLSNFNQNGLRPFLEPMLTGKKLVSVALNGNASIQYDPTGASAIKGDFAVTNLVVNDPQNQVPATPLEAKLQLDTALNKNVADLRQVRLTLTPTQRAKNEVQVTGRIDLSDTNFTQGSLKIAADSLDVTTYYDLFTGKTSAAPQPTAPSPATRPTPAPAPAKAGPETEPPPMKLPLRNFTAELNVGQFYLHEIAITNFQALAKIDQNKVLLKPFQLTLNGAPMSSTIDLDLGVAGYKYALTFDARQVPLAPLANTFQPERKGQLGGTFTAQADISGAGITGPSIKTNLTGKFDFGSTNLNLSVVNIKNPLLRSLINVIALIPDLVKSPENALGSLLSGLTSKQSSGGLADDLSKSPVDSITARGVIVSAGGGAKGNQLDLQNAVVQSPAFRAEAKGTVVFADILTNSAIQIPVTVSLSRPVAARVNLVPPNTDTNAAYVPLPQFLTMAGTVGEPKSQVNKLALLKVATQSLGGLTGGAGGKTGGLLQGILGGSKTQTNAPSQTTTNQSPSGNLLRGLGGLLGGSQPAAPATTNTAPNAKTNPPATNQSPAGNLLNQLFGPGKK